MTEAWATKDELLAELAWYRGEEYVPEEDDAEYTEPIEYPDPPEEAR